MKGMLLGPQGPRPRPRPRRRLDRDGAVVGYAFEGGGCSRIDIIDTNESDRQHQPRRPAWSDGRSDGLSTRPSCQLYGLTAVRSVRAGATKASAARQSGNPRCSAGLGDY